MIIFLDIYLTIYMTSSIITKQFDQLYTPIDEIANNLLLNFNFYISENLYEGYDFSNHFKIRLPNFKVLKSLYRYFSNRDTINNFVFWVKFNPYIDHSKIMVDLLIKVFNNKADHVEKQINCDEVLCSLRIPIEKILFFRFDEWITTIFFDGNYTSKDFDKYNSIAYDICNFVNSNYNLFIFNLD